MKLLVSDMDGTLTYDPNKQNFFSPNEKEIPEENKLAIDSFLADGNTLAIATGRLLSDVKSTIDSNLFSNIYKIVQNGSFIFDKNKKIEKLIFQNFLVK